MAIFTVEKYGDKIMQILTARYYLEFSKLTLYGFTRPQSISKSKQISGHTILSSPQDLEFNPKFGKNHDILKASSKLNLSINLFLLIAAFSSDTTYSVPGIASHTFMFSFRPAISQKMVYKQKKSKLKPFTE